MRRLLVLLLATITSLTGFAQNHAGVPPKPSDIDAAVTYVTERGKVAAISCGCFWLQGGGLNVAITFYHHLGVAADFSGGHASDIEPGVDLDKVSFMMGPRYTYPFKGLFGGDASETEGSRFFAEGLIGGVHTFNTVIPVSTGVNGAASSLAVQVGGGVDIPFRKAIGIRVVEVDYLRSSLPNNGDGTQHDLRLSAGISIHFKNWRKVLPAGVSGLGSR